MLSDSMRSAITDGSRIEHLFNSCINIAAPIRYFIDYHDNYTKWFGDDAHLCPLTVVSQFKKLKTVAAVLSESDEEKFFAAIGVTPKVLHARWWCYLSHA
jgi:hypothetical protein